jgi:adenylate cyclase
MATEIERKFLVKDESWRNGSPGVRISQGYLARDADRTVRIRIGGERAWITIKGRSTGISRQEFEYEIPVEDARELLGMCLPSVIDKTRHEVPHAGQVWEVDVFHGENEGLVVAEVELEDEAASPEIPEWVGAEVSADARYFNSHLAVTPYTKW